MTPDPEEMTIFVFQVISRKWQKEAKCRNFLAKFGQKHPFGILMKNKNDLVSI